MSHRVAAIVLLLCLVGLADEPMSSEVIRVTFERAFDRNTPNPVRHPLLRDLIRNGPKVADVVGKDVNDRLMPEASSGQDTENLIRLAASFGDRGSVVVPGLTARAALSDVYAPQAIEALASIGAPARSAVPTLIKKETYDPQITLAVIDALARIGGPEAEAALKDRTGHAKPLIATAAKLALARVAPASPDAAAMRKQAVEALVIDTREGDTSRRASARRMIAGLDAEDALAFLPLMTDTKSRRAAIAAICAIHTGDPDESGRGGGFEIAPTPPKERLKNLSPTARTALASLEAPLVETIGTNDISANPAMTLLAALFPDSGPGVDAVIAKLEHASQPNDVPIRTLVSIGPKALPKLRARLASLQPSDREYAWTVVAIVRIDPAAAPDPATFAKQSRLPQVTKTEIIALMGDRGLQFMLDEVANGLHHSQFIDAARIPRTPATFKAVVQRITAAGAKPMRGHIEVLAQTATPGDLPTVLEVVKKMPAEVQKELAGVVTNLLRDNPTVQKQLIVSPDRATRLMAAQSYANRPLDAETVTLLLDVWSKDADEEVRKAITNAIQGYGGNTALELLIKRVESWPEARQAEAMNIIRSMARNNIAIVEPLLASKSPILRAQTVSILASAQAEGSHWPTPAVQKLASDPSPMVRAAVADTLAPRGADWPPMLFTFLGDTDADVRLAAVRSLTSESRGGPTPTDAPPQFIALLKDPDPRVRARVRSTTRLSMAKVVSPFKEMLAADKWEKCSALELMARGASGELQPMVLQELKSPDPVIRAYAAAAVGGLPATVEASTALAQAALTDQDPTVRTLARRTLGTLHRKLPIATPGATQPASPPARPAAQRLEFAEDAVDDASVLASVYVGQPDKPAVTMLSWLGGNNDRKVEAAAEALRYLFRNDRSASQTLSVELPKQSQLTRVLVAATVDRPPYGQPPIDASRRTYLPPDELAKFATRTDRIGKIARLLGGTPPGQKDKPTDVSTLLNDRNVHVRTLAHIHYAAETRSLTPQEQIKRREALYRAMSDADIEFAAIAQQVGSDNHLFGDGSVKTDIPQSVRDACLAIEGRLRGCEPGERVALVRESLNVAGESPFLVPTWSRLLTDYDPAVRTLALKGLRRYGDIWRELRSIR